MVGVSPVDRDLLALWVTAGMSDGKQASGCDARTGRGAKTHLPRCNYYKMTFRHLLCEVMEPQEQLSWAVLKRLLRNDSLGKFLRTATAVRLSVPSCYV